MTLTDNKGLTPLEHHQRLAPDPVEVSTPRHSPALDPSLIKRALRCHSHMAVVRGIPGLFARVPAQVRGIQGQFRISHFAVGCCVDHVSVLDQPGCQDYDANGDGKLTAAELTAGLKKKHYSVREIEVCLRPLHPVDWFSNRLAGGRSAKQTLWHQGMFNRLGGADAVTEGITAKTYALMSINADTMG